MTSDFTGFNFLPSSTHPVADIRRGYGLASLATSDTSVSSTVGVASAAATVGTTTVHGIALVLHLG